MNAVACPVCASRLLQPSVVKSGVSYWRCEDCEAIFADNIDTAVILTHNEAPEGRMDVAIQKQRVLRILEHLGRKPDKVLDFGCGRGDYVTFLQKLGIDAEGIDQDTPLKLSDVAMRSVDVINMVEVIEHLPHPMETMGELVERLKSGGLIYIESSFTDFLGDPAASHYIEPSIGHCCIHSRRSIAWLSWQLRLHPIWLNNNVVTLTRMDRLE